MYVFLAIYKPLVKRLYLKKKQFQGRYITRQGTNYIKGMIIRNMLFKIYYDKIIKKIPPKHTLIS